MALLERTTRQVRLTAAGEVLLRDARTALEAVTAAADRARQAGSQSPRLRVALKADVDGGLLPQILDAYCADDAALHRAQALKVLAQLTADRRIRARHIGDRQGRVRRRTNHIELPTLHTQTTLTIHPPHHHQPVARP